MRTSRDANPDGPGTRGEPDRYERLQAELDGFCYAVSHDLRAPLRAIDGFSRVLEEDHAAALGADGLDALARVRGAAARMNAMIDGLLNLARLARLELVRETVDLTALAQAIMADLRRREPHRQVTVSIAPGLTAHADARLARLALEHLLGNAWKFTSRTEAAAIALSAEEPESGYAFRVQDNGAGFDMQGYERLFGPFQRLHAEADYPGLGVGLATVQRIVGRHGGRIRAEGRVNGGAAVTFTLQPEDEGT